MLLGQGSGFWQSQRLVSCVQRARRLLAWPLGFQESQLGDKLFRVWGLGLVGIKAGALYRAALDVLEWLVWLGSSRFPTSTSAVAEDAARQGQLSHCQ